MSLEGVMKAVEDINADDHLVAADGSVVRVVSIKRHTWMDQEMVPSTRQLIGRPLHSQWLHLPPGAAKVHML
jgi:hypothetical protein